MNRAIQASLSVMTEEKMKKPKTVEEERKTPSPELLQDTQQFPSLGKMKEEPKPLRCDSPATVDSDSEKSSRSLAQRLAKKSKQSVQHGAMGEEDFPTLLMKPSKPEITVNVVKTSKPAPHAYSVASKLGPAGVQEDFPSLPVSKPNSASSASIGRWGKNSAAGGKGFKTVKTVPSVSSQSPLDVIMSDRSGKGETKKDKPRNSRNQTFTSENDFPTLSSAGVENRNTDWLKNVTEKKKVKQVKPIDWFDINNESNEFSIENLSGDKDNKQLITEAYKETKKKKKTKKTKLSSNGGKSASDDVMGGTSSLDNIATSWLGNGFPASEEKKVVKVVEEICVKEVEQTSEKIESNTTTSEPVANVDPPVEDQILERNVEESFIPVKIKEKKSKEKKNGSLDSSDFPALSAPPVKGPPPGFSKAKAKKPPPGFESPQTPVLVSSTVLAPPPGFASSSLVDLKDLSLKNLMDSVSNESRVPNADTPGVFPESYRYEEPKDFQSRNKDLVMKIKDVFQENEDKFSTFKSCSSDFRGGTVSAIEYYNKCTELIGLEHFIQIFTELLVLLPDIEKQQQLLDAHKMHEKSKNSAEKVLKISGKSSAAPWSSQPDFVACPVCHQILLQGDYNQHVSMHNLEADYPSLGSRVTAQGPGMRAWIKAN